MQLNLLSWQPEPELTVEPETKRSPRPQQGTQVQSKYAIAWFETCIRYNRRQMLKLMQNREGSEGKRRSRKLLTSSLHAECETWLARIQELGGV